MDAEQDWCLQCGAGAPGSVQPESHRRRSAALVLSAAALLVAGAAVAAYAALSKSSSKPRAAAATPAQRPGAAATLPPTASATPTPPTPRPTVPAKPLVPPVKKANTPLTGAATKSPAATTPPTTPPASGGTTTTPAAGTKTSSGSTTTPKEKQPAALVLDTDAATTYNPYSYPASSFGDPSLTIDGEPSTGWTAKVDPAVAPRMAEGLLIDLKTARRLSALALTTSTPGMTIQVYGAATAAAPPSITDPAWVRLSGVLVDKQRSLRVPLADSKRAFRFVTLWISAAPAAAVGTPAHPGHVSVNELELFPAR